MGISFERGGKMGVSMQGFADASYADKAFDRRSVSGGVVSRLFPLAIRLLWY